MTATWYLSFFWPHSLWGMQGAFPEGMFHPWSSGICAWYSSGARFAQQGSPVCTLGVGTSHGGRRGGCALCGHEHPQGGALWPVRRGAGFQGQIVRLFLMDSKFDPSWVYLPLSGILCNQGFLWCLLHHPLIPLRERENTNDSVWGHASHPCAVCHPFL